MASRLLSAGLVGVPWDAWAGPSIARSGCGELVSKTSTLTEELSGLQTGDTKLSGTGVGSRTTGDVGVKADGGKSTGPVLPRDSGDCDESVVCGPQS